ncbi:MAG TPA: hypothetical protein VGL36_35850 [Kribbella sp.]
METLEHALEELRLWSSPGRRAELVAAAWRCGETNVSTLAEAARVTRQTVYTDLEACGIDPHDERGSAQKPPRWLEPLIPMWSHEATTEEEAWNAILGAANLPLDVRPADPPQNRSDELLDMMIRQWRYAQYHRKVLPLLGPEYECKLRATRAIHRAETAWEALRSAKHWAAAHHQWIEAVDGARRAIGAWSSAVEARADLESDENLAAFRDGGMEGLPEDALVPVCDVDQVTLVAADLEETYRERLALTRVTLSAVGDA